MISLARKASMVFPLPLLKVFIKVMICRHWGSIPLDLKQELNMPDHAFVPIKESIEQNADQGPLHGIVVTNRVQRSQDKSMHEDDDIANITKADAVPF